MDKIPLPVVFLGSVDHGKSTLIGRTLYETESIPKDIYNEIRSVLDSGEEVEFAFLMDQLQEEQEREITIDTTQAFIVSGQHNYLLIDAPGHVEFLKNAITGTSYAEIGVLLLDISEGICPQTIRHIYMAKLAGLKQIILVVNKIDLIEPEKQKTLYNKFTETIKEALRKFNLLNVLSIPVSAKKGWNVSEKNSSLDWYNGPTLLGVLDKYTKEEITSNIFFHFRFAVQCTYINKKTKYLLGRISSGEIFKGDTVYINSKDKASVEEIVNGWDYVNKASTGDSIALKLNTTGIDRGKIVYKGQKPILLKNVSADIIAFSPITVGDSCYISVLTQNISAKITSIKNIVNPEHINSSKKTVNSMASADMGLVNFELSGVIAVEKKENLPPMARIAIQKNNSIIAGGILCI